MSISRRSYPPLLALCLSAFCLAAAGAQEEAENLDDLFADPEPDLAVQAPAVDHLAAFVQDDRIGLSGYFEATGGVGAGWTSWPVLSDPSQGFDGTVGLTATARLYLDARPDPDFRFYGAFSTTMNPLAGGGSTAWPSFGISELFIDYTWLGSVFIRMGQHGMAWGQGRLFEGITNLMSDAGGMFSLRASLPALLSGVSAVALLPPGATSYQQLAYAAKADLVFLETLLSLGVRYQKDSGPSALVSVKRTIWGVDILADAALRYTETSWNPRILAGFFKEWERAKLYGEYYYDGTAQPGLDHTAGLAFGYKDVLGTPLDLGLKWFHAFLDHSGSATAALVWKPWKYITAIVALPVAYGPDGGRYVAASNPDAAKRRLALLFGLEMKVSF